MSLKIVFPDPRLADKDGLVAVGGELSAKYLISAYSKGIFPWFSKGDPVLWWSPDPRMVLFPADFYCSKSLRQLINSNRFEVKFDSNFKKVIENCAYVVRKGQQGTWITDDMIEAYISLHENGYSHSIETYHKGKLVGGLYGVSIGKAFFGESMFHFMSDASKYALYFLTEFLKKKDFDFIDVQQSTSHLKSLGAKNIAREDFLKMNKDAVAKHFEPRKWDSILNE